MSLLQRLGRYDASSAIRLNCSSSKTIRKGAASPHRLIQALIDGRRTPNTHHLSFTPYVNKGR